MKAVLHNIWARYERAMVGAGRARVRQELLRMSDRALLDAGFSRERLEAGVGAWPWRLVDDSAEAAAATRAERARREAERCALGELAACSDAELADLGIVRADIPRAVREGRVGVEVEASRGRDGDRLVA